jgi:hypothetical protein
VLKPSWYPCQVELTAPLLNLALKRPNWIQSGFGENVNTLKRDRLALLISAAFLVVSAWMAQSNTPAVLASRAGLQKCRWPTCPHDESVAPFSDLKEGFNENQHHYGRL